MLALLKTYVGPYWRRAALLLVLLLIGVSLQLAGPQLLRGTIDAAAGGASNQFLALLAGLYLLAALLGQVVLVAEHYFGGALGWDTTNRLRVDLLRHCLRLDPPFFAANPPGALVARIDGDVTRLSKFFAELLVQLISNVLLLCGIMALSFILDWRAGLGIAIFALVTFFTLYGLRKVAVQPWENASRSDAELYGFLEERLSGTEDLRALGATGYAAAGLSTIDGRLRRAWRRAAAIGSIPISTALVLLAGAAALALGLGGWLYVRGEMSIGDAYLLFAYAELLRRPMEQFGRQIEELQQAGAGAVRVNELFNQRSNLLDGVGPPLPPGPLGLNLNSVDFVYADGPQNPAAPQPAVLHNITLQLHPGEVLGLLGRTGSGKSTLARLLFRLYDPTQGSVCLGGRDLRDLALNDLRSRIGFVTQDIQLFHASVRDNLTLFDADIPDQRMLGLLEELGLGSWLAHQPAGLDSMIAPDGSNLSAGESQLLALARVFLHDPGLVILDEASSRLDPATEALIEQAINRLLSGRTAVIIAHRLRTVQRADKILILEDGRMAEYGPRIALAANPQSRFAELLRIGLEAEVTG